MKEMSVKLRGISPFGINWVQQNGKLWQVRKITDNVLFSAHPGPWMLLERDHFQRWVNLCTDKHFLVRWGRFIH